jgi:hypothetical protein
MTGSWRYFGGAAILAAGLLLKFAAPLPAVLLGIAGAAGVKAWFLMRQSGRSGGSV